MKNSTRSPRSSNFDHPNCKVKNLDNKQKPPEHSITWQLWENAAQYRQKALESTFIQEIGNGTLPPVKLGQYLVQDCAYCYAAMNDYLGIENSTSKSYPELSSFAQCRYTGYESYYKDESEAWHIGDPSALSLSQAAKQYIESEKNAWTKYHPIYGVIAMIPCDQLWPWLGGELEKISSKSNLYYNWIKNNFGTDFKSSYRLDNFINLWFEQNPDAFDQDIATYVFTCSMLGEVNFFRSACGQDLIPLPSPPNK